MNISLGIGCGDNEERPDLLTPFEVESYVEALEKSGIDELGSLSWLEKHSRLKQLTIQSIIQALSNKEETVKDSITTYEKVPILVHELILVELWRERVFPKLLNSLKTSKKIQGSFTLYPILYHESAVLNLLETILYHSATVETLGDSSTDLVDYCLRTLGGFLATKSFDEEEEEDFMKTKESSGDLHNVDIDLQKQSETLLLGISLKALSTLRYIIDNIEQLGNGLISRLVLSTDTPMLLTELIVQKPWRKEFWKDGKIFDFEPTSGQWKEIDPSAKMIINNTEAQAWLSLYLLLKNNRILSSYELYDSRKNNLLKLRHFLNEITLDQIPILAEFQLFLTQLSVTTGPFGPSKGPLLLEMLPQIRTQLEQEFDKDGKKIIQCYKADLLCGSKEVMLEKAKCLAAAYDLDTFQAALPTPKKCAAGCGKEADKRCSRCKEVWYCGKECQVNDWKNHRENCQN